MYEPAWLDVVSAPVAGRTQKPRRLGLTMVMDKGLGLGQTAELLELAAPYIDFLKLGFGTSFLYSPKLLHEKIKLVRAAGIHIYPGGTFLEIAFLQNRLEPYLERVAELGYTYVEVSDGTIPMTRADRRRAIRLAQALGLGVLTEVGKKDSRDQVSLRQIKEQVMADLADGAERVIVEGRESGRGVVIFDRHGFLRLDELESLLDGLPVLDRLIGEAPQKHQQQELILRFGPNVNLGNIPPAEVLALEALRRGLRGDTLRAALYGEGAVAAGEGK